MSNKAISDRHPSTSVEEESPADVPEPPVPQETPVSPMVSQEQESDVETSQEKSTCHVPCPRCADYEAKIERLELDKTRQTKRVNDLIKLNVDINAARLSLKKELKGIKARSLNIDGQTPAHPISIVSTPPKNPKQVLSVTPNTTATSAVSAADGPASPSPVNEEDRRRRLIEQFGDADFKYDNIDTKYDFIGDVDQWCFFKHSQKVLKAQQQRPELLIEQRKKDEVTINKGDEYVGYPIVSFAELKTKYIHDDVKIKNEQGELVSPFEPILNIFAEKNFQGPREVQRHCWTPLMSGCDVLAVAKTGSGKTLGFMVPAILHILTIDKRDHAAGKPSHKERYIEKSGAFPNVVILAPTRELIIQIQQETGQYCASHDIGVTVVYGGSSKNDQRKCLDYNTRIVCGVAGRLKDFIFNDKAISLRNVSYFVLDEADRMLDNGFGPDIMKISHGIRPDRQVAFFSATWSKSCEDYARRLLRNVDRFVHIQIGGTDLDVGQVETIKHSYHILTDERRKEDWLRSFLAGRLPEYPGAKDHRSIIFMKSKVKTEQMYNRFSHEGMKVVRMQGDLDNAQRQDSLAKFKEGKAICLIASDVAQRGLDVKGVTYVVHYDPPDNMDDYTHRSGRTGRADNEGNAISLFASNTDKKLAADLLKRWPKLGKGPRNMDPSLLRRWIEK